MFYTIYPKKSPNNKGQFSGESKTKKTCQIRLKRIPISMPNLVQDISLVTILWSLHPFPSRHFQRKTIPSIFSSHRKIILIKKIPLVWTLQTHDTWSVSNPECHKVCRISFSSAFNCYLREKLKRQVSHYISKFVCKISNSITPDFKILLQMVAELFSLSNHYLKGTVGKTAKLRPFSTVTTPK